MKQKLWKSPWFFLVCATTALVIFLLYFESSPRIQSNVFIGDTEVSNLTRSEALARIAGHTENLNDELKLTIENKPYPIAASDIDLAYDSAAAVNQAWQIGRTGGILKRSADLLTVLVKPTTISLQPTFNGEKLRNEIATIAEIVNEHGKDIRLRIVDGSVLVLTDTKLGFFLDQPHAYAAAAQALKTNQPRTESIPLTVVKATVSPASVPAAKEQAERILQGTLKLTFEKKTYELSTNDLGPWILSLPQGPDLIITLDEQKIREYVTTLAHELNAEPRAPKLTVVNGKVTEFVAPTTGRSLDQTQTVAAIKDVLEKRRIGETTVAELNLPVNVAKPIVTDESAAELGIQELIGSATTPFTGSPKNRISNIKNGSKFLSGILVKPGEEFSTLTALGTIDNTTGYLPELVIKGNETVPEYGGGLCQVSTTLFRSIMNTGLPITARQNHSYRVSYYEKDGTGKRIGPGLDATIYLPNPDFKFINDTPATILIQGHVDGDKVTFDIYGTKDGRNSAIDGPYTLTETPAGNPIYTETDTLKPGVQKQVERPHPGGTAIATYTITYPDGTKKEQVFKSFYRNWPARFLVGAAPHTTTTEALAPVQ